MLFAGFGHFVPPVALRMALSIMVDSPRSRMLPAVGVVNLKVLILPLVACRFGAVDIFVVITNWLRCQLALRISSVIKQNSVLMVAAMAAAIRSCRQRRSIAVVA